MPRTQYYAASTINGLIADSDDRLDWLFQFNDVPGLGEHYTRFFEHVGAVAMGRSTYEFILGEDPGWPYPDVPTWVFTHREAPVRDGADVRLTDAGVAEVHAAMAVAAGDRNIWLVGGGALVADFARHDLLDEIWLGLAPVVLDAGAPLLPVRIDKPMTLSEVTRFGDSGFVELRYEIER